MTFPVNAGIATPAAGTFGIQVRITGRFVNNSWRNISTPSPLGTNAGAAASA